MLGRLTFGRVAASPELPGRNADVRAGARIILAQLAGRFDSLLERRVGVLQRARHRLHARKIPEAWPPPRANVAGTSGVLVAPHESAFQRSTSLFFAAWMYSSASS